MTQEIPERALANQLKAEHLQLLEVLKPLKNQAYELEQKRRQAEKEATLKELELQKTEEDEKWPLPERWFWADWPGIVGYKDIRAAFCPDTNVVVYVGDMISILCTHTRDMEVGAGVPLEIIFTVINRWKVENSELTKLNNVSSPKSNY